MYRFAATLLIALTTADFDAMRVGMAVPTDVEDQGFVWYTVTLKLFWYRADGSVGSKVSHLFTPYRMYVDGEDQGTWTLEEYCPAWLGNSSTARSRGATMGA